MKQHHSTLPIRGNISLIYLLSILIVILMTMVSFISILYSADVYMTDELITSFVLNDVVNLFIGLPILLGSMWLTWRRKWIGLFCWPGALFFVTYNYIAYIFAMPMHWALVMHLMLCGLSIYTYSYTLRSIC